MDLVVVVVRITRLMVVWIVIHLFLSNYYRVNQDINLLTSIIIEDSVLYAKV